MSYPLTTRYANPGTPEGLGVHLELIDHAQSCPIGDSDPEERCPDPRCQPMKSILYHALLCDRSDCCYVEGCYETRQLEKHLRKCFNDDCVCCSALAFREDQIARGEIPGPPRGDADTKRRLLQIQLLEFILHIHKCQSEKSRVGDCGLSNCQELEDALLHKPICELLSACPYPGCIATDYALSHWKLCETQDCLICEPVRLNLKENILFRYPPSHRPKDRYFIAQHIEQLLHALTCAERDRDLTREIPNCPRPNCELMKSLLQHVPRCDDDKCKKAQCASSKRILKHWTPCMNLDCPTCVNEPKDNPDAEADSSGPRAQNRHKQSPSNPQIPDMYPPSMEPPSFECSPEAQGMIQRMLSSLLHAHKCSTKPRTVKSAPKSHPCTIEGCEDELKVYHHLLECKNYELCTSNDRCTLSRKIIHHWKTCNRKDCALCSSMKVSVPDSLRG